MKVAILYDAGSDEWSPQDVAAVVGNVHEVRDVLRRAETGTVRRHSALWSGQPALVAKVCPNASAAPRGCCVRANAPL